MTKHEAQIVKLKKEVNELAQEKAISRYGKEKWELFGKYDWEPPYPEVIDTCGGNSHSEAGGVEIVS